jgi:hypothetical protein
MQHHGRGYIVDVIRVRAPSRAHADRLISSVNGGFLATAVANGNPSSNEVEVRLDAETATKLVELFNILGLWLSAGGLDTCQIGMGERSYTLLAAGSEPSDPTTFLLERTIQLQTALDSRIVIEQAKGILAEREGISPDKAFHRMRRDARSRRMKLHDLAAGIVATVNQPAVTQPSQPPV